MRGKTNELRGGVDESGTETRSRRDNNNACERRQRHQATTIQHPQLNNNSTSTHDKAAASRLRRRCDLSRFLITEKYFAFNCVRFSGFRAPQSAGITRNSLGETLFCLFVTKRRDRKERRNIKATTWWRCIDAGEDKEEKRKTVKRNWCLNFESKPLY